jgi:hypothetical protein
MEIIRQNKELKKTANSFCSRTCAALYYNEHRLPETNEKISQNLKKNFLEDLIMFQF